MAEIVRYINTASSAGGDGTTNATAGANRAYASMAAWNTAEANDLVAAGNTHKVHCEGTAADTNCTISGWTTGVANYITVVVDQAVRHDGKYNTGKYRIEATDVGAALDIFPDYTRVEGIQIKLTATSGGRRGILARGNFCQVSNSLFWAVLSGAATTAQGVEGFGSDIKVWNCIAWDWVNAATVCRGLFQDGGGTAYFYNNTAHNCRTGIGDGFGTTVAKNNCVQDCTLACYAGSFGAASTNNCSDDATQPGSNGQNGEVTFVDEANDDFHLASGDTVAKDNGTDLSADANLAFSDDCDGNTRTGTWDIGADELVATGAFTGTTSLTFGTTGALTGTGALAGTTSLTFATAGALTGTGALAGTTSLTFALTGVLGGSGALAGTTSLTFALTGSLADVGAFTGTTSLTFSLTATLTPNELAPTPPETFVGSSTGALCPTRARSTCTPRVCPEPTAPSQTGDIFIP